MSDEPQPREGGKLPTIQLGCGNQSAYISLVNRRKVPFPSLRLSAAPERRKKLGQHLTGAPHISSVAPPNHQREANPTDRPTFEPKTHLRRQSATICYAPLFNSIKNLPLFHRCSPDNLPAVRALQLMSWGKCQFRRIAIRVLGTADSAPDMLGPRSLAQEFRQICAINGVTSLLSGSRRRWKMTDSLWGDIVISL
jgi:hypothetical protein